LFYTTKEKEGLILPKEIIKYCPTCNKKFITTAGNARYCSKACKYGEIKRKRLEEKPQEFNCAWCGETFVSSRKKKYCCKECRLIANGRKSSKKSIKQNRLTLIEGSLADVNQKARDAGLSYGHYTGRIYAETLLKHKE
jgi:endogenous inhibitor of DNA gyrase (YacG/DUF329 family)